MIAIENILISDDVVESQFVCDLSKCKGGCCEDGDAGAPLEPEELDHVVQLFERIKPFLSANALKEIERQGLYRYDKEFGWVTPTIDGGICVYGLRDDNGTIKCAFEKLYNEEGTPWKKPISCHLYPIKTKKSKNGEYEMVNYEPRETLCKPGCVLGKKLKVPVYQFLQESFIRKYGPEFYDALHHVALDYFEAKGATKKIENEK
ncbi:MAG: DUF3109 family protein [Chitinophagaceae bacterium]